MAEYATRHGTASQTQWPVRACRCQKNVPTKNLDREIVATLRRVLFATISTLELNEEPSNEMNEKEMW